MAETTTAAASQNIITQNTKQTIQRDIVTPENAIQSLIFRRPIQSCDLIPSPWWSEQRERDLRTFVKLRGNDILQSALSDFSKRFKAMGWYIRGPQKITFDEYLKLQQANFGKGLSELIAITITRYLESDKGAYWELIGEGSPDTPLRKVEGVAYLDGDYCIPTGDWEYPVIYTNSKGGTATKMHRTRIVRFVDWESPSRVMHGIGFCAVSRIIQSSSILLKIAKYKEEKLNDLPATGLLLFNNILPTKWDDKLAEHEAYREQLGQYYWQNIITMFGLDPTQPATAEFISFAEMPENFDELLQTEIYIQILALSLGMSPSNIWQLKGSAWNPTATEITVQQEQGHNRGIGEIIKSIERAINWYVLPKTCTFNFDFIDDAQDEKATRGNKNKIQAIMELYKPPTAQQLELGMEQPISNEVIRRLLVENVSWFDEEWFDTKFGDDTITLLSEADKAKHLGPMVKINREGKVSRTFSFIPMG